jgi:hypothetical protein
MPEANAGTNPNVGTYTTGWSTTGSAEYQNLLASVKVIMGENKGISPQLYFSYVKSKFGLLEKSKLERRMKKLEAAFNNAVDNGQEALGQKFLNELSREMNESLALAKGIKYFITREDLRKHKNRIRGGHISDTQFEEFTRVIPKDVLEKKKKVEGIFDGFVIYHYWDESAEAVRAGKQKMTSEEKNKMRDPVLFGYFQGNERLYFVADWEDEFCDLTFDELIDFIGKSEDGVRIPKNPELSL